VIDSSGWQVIELKSKLLLRLFIAEISRQGKALRIDRSRLHIAVRVTVSTIFAKSGLW